MAKENYVSLKGQLRQEAKYIIDSNTNEIKSAILRLTVIRRDIRNLANDFEPKFDHPIVSTTTPDMIRCIQSLNLHDIVEIKGIYKTKWITKHCRCPHCDTINAFDIDFPTIVPIFVGSCDKCKSNVEGLEYLKKYAEISNIVKVIGRVCVDEENITYSETDRGDKYASYKIAVNRKFYDPESENADDHTDYPVIYSYNDVAEKDHAVLKKGSLIYIDGYLHTMKKDIEVVCCECKESFKTTIQRMNVTPYSTEYLRDYKDDVLDSIHKKETTNDPVPTHEPDKGDI